MLILGDEGLKSVLVVVGLAAQDRSLMDDRSVRDAVLLAAGRGTRMKGLTEDVPKPMLPVDGRPLLEHILIALRDSGIERFVVIVGYHADRIREHFGDGGRFGVRVDYRVQEVRDGTAGALRLAEGGIGGRPFLLGWGDILTAPANYTRLLDRFAGGAADLVLAVNWVEDPYRGAAVYAADDGRIERIVEKPSPGTSTTHWHNAGIGVASAALFTYAARVPRSPRGEFEIPDALTAMIADGRRLEIVPLEGAWLDVGTPEDLARAAEVLREARS